MRCINVRNCRGFQIIGVSTRIHIIRADESGTRLGVGDVLLMWSLRRKTEVPVGLLKGSEVRCASGTAQACLGQAPSDRIGNHASRQPHSKARQGGNFQPPSTLHIHLTNDAMQSQVWDSTIPLHFTHPSSPIPYLIQVPRLSYLPLLLPRLTLFFGPASSFSYEGILLKNLPVGLLCDLYQPPLPWRLVLGDGPLFDIHDTFINSVKEVCPSALHGRPILTYSVPGRLHPKWHSQGHNVHVERELDTTMELGTRQQVPSFLS
jgi:hypothetical protein